MAKKFTLNGDMLNGISKNTEKVSILEAKENFKIEYIDIDDIVRNEKNFYEIVDIEELAEDISINGLNHNLVVRPFENKFELISGERRYTAIKYLISKGNNKFKKVPCKVSKLNDLDSEIVLIQSNAQTRELSDKDRLIQIQRLTELYNIKKSKGEIVGRVRELISKDTGLSSSQVGRYSAINKGLIPELKEKLNNGKLTINNASEFSVLSDENQRIILDLIQSEVDITKSEANKLKNEFKELEKEKELLVKKQKDQELTILELNNINKEKSIEINKEIEKLKLELNNKFEDNVKRIKEEELANLELEKSKLESEKLELEKKLESTIDSSNKNIDKIISEKAKELTKKFEKDKSSIEKENEKLKKELASIKNDGSKIAINKELNIRLNSTRKEVNKIAGLMANNTIMDEDTLKEVVRLKESLRFLDEQIKIYTEQEKF